MSAGRESSRNCVRIRRYSATQDAAEKLHRSVGRAATEVSAHEDVKMDRISLGNFIEQVVGEEKIVVEQNVEAEESSLDKRIGGGEAVLEEEGMELGFE